MSPNQILMLKMCSLMNHILSLQKILSAFYEALKLISFTLKIKSEMKLKRGKSFGQMIVGEFTIMITSFLAMLLENLSNYWDSCSDVVTVTPNIIYKDTRLPPGWTRQEGEEKDPDWKIRCVHLSIRAGRYLRLGLFPAE